MLSSSGTLISKVAREVRKAGLSSFKDKNVIRVLEEIFKDIFIKVSKKAHPTLVGTHYYRLGQTCSSNGYIRSDTTSRLVSEFIHGVRVGVNERNPPLSKAYLQRETLEKVEVLKHFTYRKLIMSTVLKVSEYRGYEIVQTIFKALKEKDGYRLLPDDFQVLYKRLRGKAEKQRVIADYIAGMTDRYAVEFYGRLTSENALTIFKPL